MMRFYQIFASFRCSENIKNSFSEMMRLYEIFATFRYYENMKNSFSEMMRFYEIFATFRYARKCERVIILIKYLCKIIYFRYV